jgi:hypothetical protein
MRVVRSLYLNASYGSGFLELKFLNLAQAAEAYHRRCYPNSLYLAPSAYEEQVRRPLTAAIPKGLSASLRTSLVKRLEFGNEYSFRRRLKDLFGEHEAALATAIPEPCRWIKRIVGHRNDLTHHPVVGDRSAFNHEEMLQCIYVLRMLIELCFLR